MMMERNISFEDGNFTGKACAHVQGCYRFDNTIHFPQTATIITEL